MKRTFTLLLLLTAGLTGTGLHAQQLFSNGGFTTGATAKDGSAAPTGYTWSEVQNDAGVTTISNTNAGFSSLKSSNFELADDFTVPAGRRWTINSVGVYGYQTGYAGTTSPFTAIYIRIWNGPPSSATSQVIYGDLVTNRFTSSTDALSYRIFNSLYPAPSATGTTRRIWRVVATLPTPVSLPAGTYWVSYSTTTTTTTAHFMVPVTTVGLRQTPGANAQQTGSTGAWAPIQDAGNPAGPIVSMDMAFDLQGTSVLGTTAATPEFALRVGPVPASSLATAEFTSLKKPATFVLTDIQGRSVWKASSAVGSTSLQVPLDGMAAGTYLLTMTSELGSSRARLLKQ
ncbi:T9SS type A sorting domain-containing protein [Hymenobacter sediminicola]|uniref:T9SS type A sorting domain-containing protein n=1 Tax=Hymenobacter sediminicola TaxID=2761579 RepID=A0A7G7W5M4_9BACT|nr:T9SS type A sorting domain-containing protein [Hymenobacter sediminicola]QNH61667.1 T9SS type A sorting domain-containing protein [Hymenobacter sediminicola]